MPSPRGIPRYVMVAIERMGPPGSRTAVQQMETRGVLRAVDLGLARRRSIGTGRWEGYGQWERTAAGQAAVDEQRRR